jgi:PhoPQ-activated pathogenicity-related protein
MKKIVIALSLLLIIQVIASADLFDYVAKPDASYKWEKLEQKALPFDMQKYDIKMISQTWKDIVWDHRISLITPKNIKNPTMVLLMITGSWSKNDTQEVMFGSAIANGIGAPIAILYDVPRQPLFGGKSEDSLIAYTFTKVMETGDPEWALLLPMTKSAVRAMDTIEQFIKQELKTDVSGFVVTGGSKRGWTTWLSSAVDKRVKGIAPAVYDNLNLPEQMKHQVDTWGTYSEQIDDYSVLSLPQQLADEKGRKLASLVDPYTYKDKVTVPKLIIVGSNDRYWPLDAMNIYFDDLVGEKYILRVPNKGHGVNDDPIRIISSEIAFFQKINGNLTFPKLTWNYMDKEDGLETMIMSDQKPKSISVWTASSDTKDFRNSKWQETKLEPMGPHYMFTLKKPEKGYSAIFGEAVYPSGDKEYYLSTEVRIIGAK